MVQPSLDSFSSRQGGVSSQRSLGKKEDIETHLIFFFNVKEKRPAKIAPLFWGSRQGEIGRKESFATSRFVRGGRKEEALPQGHLRTFLCQGWVGKKEG